MIKEYKMSSDTVVDKAPSSFDPSANFEKIKEECEAYVKQQAKLSAIAAIVPIPLVDLLVDASLLGKLLPEISQRFGLSDSDKAIDLDKAGSGKQLKDRALGFAGLVVSRSIAKKTFQGFGGRIIAKEVTKFVPFGGQLVAGTIGYLMFKKIADDHINASYKKAKALQQAQQAQDVK